MSFGFGMGFPRSAPAAGGPSLNLQFAGSTTLDSQVTFTRALNTATYFDSTGTLVTANANVPRFDYNPSTLAALGLLIEESRTNSIRNNTMVGAVAGTPGTLPTNWVAAATSNGLSLRIVGTGTESGITYVDIKYSGTTSSANLTAIYPEAANQVAALNGQTWSDTFYVSLVGGSTANITSTVVGIDENNGAGSFLAGSSTVFVPSTGALPGKRVAHTRTLTNASTAFVRPYVYFTYNNDAAIDITLRIGLPQLELGAFATSVIPTTTAAVTRSADVASVNTLSPWFNATEGTLYWEGAITAVSGTVMGGIGDTFDNTAYFSPGGLTQQWNVRSGGVNQTAPLITAFTFTSGVPYKMAATVKTNDFNLCVNGGSVANDPLGSVPLSAARLGIGNAPWSATGGNQVQQWIRRITYYPRRLSNAELQAITA